MSLAAQKIHNNNHSTPSSLVTNIVSSEIQQIRPSINIDSSVYKQISCHSNQNSKVKELRKALSNALIDFSDDQLEVLTSQCEYLVGSWLDEFEKLLFGDKTLLEISR